MADVEAYFDESESGGFFCVAGYIFERNNRIALCEEWVESLARYGVPYFHMKDATNPLGFRGLSPAATVDLSIALHDLIKKYSAGAYAVTFDLKQNHLLPSARLHGLWQVSPYILCCYWCLMSVRHWARRNQYSGAIEYVFEQGHVSQNEANRVMNDIFAVPELREQYRYSTHSFSDKNAAIPLQAADVLAWHWRKNIVERSKNNFKLRADLASLLEQHEKYFTTHFDARTLAGFLDMVVRSQNPSVMTFMITYKVDLAIR